MKRYEVVYVAVHDLSPEDFDAQLERYRSIITDDKGIVIRVDRWGKRKLAYPIRKRREGVYVLIEFVGDGAIVSEMERRLRIDDRILRYLSVKVADEVDLEAVEREIAEIREREAEKEAALAAEAAEREQQSRDDGAPEPPAEMPVEEQPDRVAGEEGSADSPPERAADGAEDSPADSPAEATPDQSAEEDVDVKEV